MSQCQVKGEELMVEGTILPLSCQLKKASGCHEPSTSCSSTAPTATPDTSTVTAMGALAWGWASMVALARASCAIESHDHVLVPLQLSGLPCKSVVQGLHNACCCWYKPMIKVYHAGELLESLDCGGFGKLSDSVNRGGY